jgi:hypothetical protein
MPFPNAEHAIVAEEKIRDYFLNRSHPVGGPKAIWFASIGYTLETGKNWPTTCCGSRDPATTSWSNRLRLA